MKIVRQLHRAWIDDVLLMRLAGGVFLGLGLLFIASGKLTTLTCNRVESTQGTCKLVSSGLLGLQMKETQLSELLGAKIVDNPMDEDSSRVILQTSDGEFPLTSSTSSDKTATTVSDINTFVQRSEAASLVVQHDEREFYFPMGGFIIAFGLFTLVFSKTSKSLLKSN